MKIDLIYFLSYGDTTRPIPLSHEVGESTPTPMEGGVGALRASTLNA